VVCIHLQPMPVYRFRFTLEDNDEVVRDIDIKPDQTFEEMGVVLQQSFKLPGTAFGAFFRSDDYFRKGEPIDVMVQGKGKKVRPLEIREVIEAPHQKFLYHYDPDHSGFMFCVELFKVMKETNEKAMYPFVSKTAGNLPKPSVRPGTPPPVDEEDLRSSDHFFALQQAGNEIDEEDLSSDISITDTPDRQTFSDDEDDSPASVAQEEEGEEEAMHEDDEAFDAGDFDASDREDEF